MTRLQARISSLERAAHCQHHTLSLPALHKLTHSPEVHSSAHSAPSSPKNPHSTSPLSPTCTQTCTSPPAHTYIQPPSAPHLSGHIEGHQRCEWSSINSSLDLPLSLKATLKEALCNQLWEPSTPSMSSFRDAVDQSWQGLSAMEATGTSNHSFNPLTYMVDEQDEGNLSREPSMQERAGERTSESRRESVSTLVGEEEEKVDDMSTLTGMLRFVNQTLAMQEDPSLWSTTGQPGSRCSLPLQVTTPPRNNEKINFYDLHLHVGSASNISANVALQVFTMFNSYLTEA